jgi:hypothetical protein
MGYNKAYLAEWSKQQTHTTRYRVVRRIGNEVIDLLKSSSFDTATTTATNNLELSWTGPIYEPR